MFGKQHIVIGYVCFAWNLHSSYPRVDNGLLPHDYHILTIVAVFCMFTNVQFNEIDNGLKVTNLPQFLFQFLSSPITNAREKYLIGHIILSYLNFLGYSSLDVVCTENYFLCLGHSCFAEWTVAIGENGLILDKTIFFSPANSSSICGC
jgi:hypothetical protein